MAATHSRNSTPPVEPVLYVAFELSCGQSFCTFVPSVELLLRCVSCPFCLASVQES